MFPSRTGPSTLSITSSSAWGRLQGRREPYCTRPPRLCRAPTMSWLTFSSIFRGSAGFSRKNCSWLANSFTHQKRMSRRGRGSLPVLDQAGQRAGDLQQVARTRCRRRWRRSSPPGCARSARSAGRGPRCRGSSPRRRPGSAGSSNDDSMSTFSADAGASSAASRFCSARARRGEIIIANVPGVPSVDAGHVLGLVADAAPRHLRPARRTGPGRLVCLGHARRARRASTPPRVCGGGQRPEASTIRPFTSRPA